MNENSGYAVFFYPPAIEALGEAIKPYLRDGPMGPHIPCREVDTGGSFIELIVEGQGGQGGSVVLELMVPSSMVRMIVSAHGDSEFGFHARSKSGMLEPGMAANAEAVPANANATQDPPSG